MPVPRGTLLALALWTAPAWAGPPYFTDDPVPTDERRFEIYGFSNGLHNNSGTSSDLGIDFNYGGARDLQLTAVVPISYEQVHGVGENTGLGNIELAAKYRFLHQQDVGWDVAVFPRVILASASSSVGAQHAVFQLPLWVGRNWDQWSTFGGGGCALNNGGTARNYCYAGWVLARQLRPALQLGAEIFYQSAAAAAARATTVAGLGATYDVSKRVHLLAYASGGLQNAASQLQYSWYAAVLWTF